MLKRYGVNRSMRKDISDRPKIGWIGSGKMGIPMRMKSLVCQFLGTMKAQGKGELDFFGLVKLLEEMAGIKA